MKAGIQLSQSNQACASTNAANSIKANNRASQSTADRNTDKVTSWIISAATTCFMAFFALLACEGEEGRFLPSPSTKSQDLIAIVSYSSTHRGVTLYDIDGNFLRHLGDFRESGVGQPRGINYLGNQTLLITTDAPDNIWTLDFEGNKEVFSGSSNFSGTIYGLVISADRQYFYATENNNIEKFDLETGLQLVGNYILGGVGGCTLSNPRAMTLSPEGYIVIANNGGTDEILRIDDTGPSPSCVSAIGFGSNPFGLLYHSNGNLYVSRQGDDSIFVADPDGQNGLSFYDPGTAILNNPTGMAELPNGDILVASSATHTIERIDQTGTRVGTIPFIADVYSQTIYDIIIIPAEEL